MKKKPFNKGKPYHGSEAVQNGGLLGSTGKTDYFFFFCPKCRGRNIMRVLDWAPRLEEEVNEVNTDVKCTRQANGAFIIAFQLYCEKCGLEDFVKIHNLGPQMGELELAG